MGKRLSDSVSDGPWRRRYAGITNDIVATSSVPVFMQASIRDVTAYVINPIQAFRRYIEGNSDNRDDLPKLVMVASCVIVPTSRMAVLTMTLMMKS